MVGVERGLVALQSLSTNKNGTSRFNFQSKEFFSMFLQQVIRYEVPWPKTKEKYTMPTSLFTKRALFRCLWSLICSQGITYSPYPAGCGGGGIVILKDVIYGPFNYVEQNGKISKFWSDVFGKMMGVRGRLVALQTISTIKKGTSPFNFQSNGSFSKFLRQHVTISEYLPDASQESTKCMCVCVGGVSTLRSLSILKRALELLITNPMGPVRIPNNHPFVIHLICLQGRTCNHNSSFTT